MQQPDKIDRIVRGLLAEAQRDYVGLWHIAMVVRRDIGLIDSDEVRIEALMIVGRLLEGGLSPGDYTRSGFEFWGENDVRAVLARIDREWVPDKGDPSLGNPICWFAPQPTKSDNRNR